MTNKKEKKELTIEQERLKLLRLYATNKGVVSRNKPRYEAITQKKIKENPEYVEKKAEYKKLYRDAEKKLIPVVKRLKEIEAIMVEVKKLKSEGKDTSHLGVKPKKPRGRPKKEKKEGEIEYKTTITKGEPLKKEDFTDEEFKLNFKLNGLISKLTKQNKQIDDAIKKATESGKNIHGIDEDEYAETAKQITKLTKELVDLNNIVRKRVGKQDIITKVQIGGPVVEKKPRGRPPKPKAEKKPRGRPRKEKPVKGPKGRPFKENTKKEIIKEVVKNNLKSIVDDIIKEHTPVKKPTKNPKLPMKIVKINKDIDKVETITTKNYKEQIDNDIVEAPTQNVMPNKEILSYLFDTFGSLTKKMSKRFEQKILPLKETSKRALHEQLSYKQNANDFHPTPQKCLNEFIDLRVDEYTNILEPSAGFGSVLYYLLDKYPNVKITAYEMFEHIYAFLKNEYPTVKTIRMNFLESNPKNNTYDIIICNPPFTVGTYDIVKNKTGYDKRFYYNFLFKCFEYMYYSKTKTYERSMIFISPPLFKEDTNDKPVARDSVRDINQLLNISPKKKMEILKQSTYLAEDYTKKNVKDVFDRYVDDIGPAQIQCKGKCTFQTTATAVYIYQCFFFKG